MASGAQCLALFVSLVSPLRALRAPSPLTRREAVMRSFASTALLVSPLAAMAGDDDAMALVDEEIATLRRAYDALDRAQPEVAEPLLRECIDAWIRARMPSAEVASLHRLRGSARLQLENLPGALSDLDVAFVLASKGGAADEQLQVLQVRALVLEAQADWARADADLSALVGREQEGFGLSGPNPFLRMRRARARQALGNYRGASADLTDAEQQLLAIGDRIRAVLAACELALAQFGADDGARALDTMERVFRVYQQPGSNNPDDLPLLEEISRREAELHLALASYLAGAPAPPDAAALARADAEWGVGCLRLSVYDESLEARKNEESRRRLSPSPSELVGRSLARLTGLAPDSPYVTQLPGEGFWWYSVGGGATKRRSPMNLRAKAERTRVSCAAFDDGGEYARKERSWPPLLVERLRVYRERKRAA